MATLKILNSGSSGNSYILECNDEILLIELGLPWKDILNGLNYSEGLQKVRGCLTSHLWVLHKDHSISIPKAIRYCLDVFSCQEVQSVHSSVKVLRKGVKTQIGGFRVQPFPLYHSAECIGFVIETPDKQKIVFATDTNKIPYRFKGVNHFIVECNNNFDDMVDNLCDNNASMSNSKDHMEISDTIEFLKQNYSSDLQSVTLIHLSNTNIDAKRALERVKEELGFDRVWIAEKGLEIELEKEEF